MNGTILGVYREAFQLHGTFGRYCQPHRVPYGAILEDAKELVRARHSMHVGRVGVDEECVGLPEPLEHFNVNREHVGSALVGETRVGPLLSEIALELVLHVQFGDAAHAAHVEVH